MKRYISNNSCLFLSSLHGNSRKTRNEFSPEISSQTRHFLTTPMGITNDNFKQAQSDLDEYFHPINVTLIMQC